MVTPQAHTPLELLEKQAQLLSSINNIQQGFPNAQRQFYDFSVKWLNEFLEEERKQTHHLSNISTAATIFTILTVLGIIAGFLGGY